MTGGRLFFGEIKVSEMRVILVILIVEVQQLLMVKQVDNKSDCELSTNQSHCSDSELIIPETLEAIIEQLPKLSQAQKKQSYHMLRSSKATSRKWSLAETNKFYELLGHYGLDFTAISYHPHFANRRSQKELSNKYKKQSRNNSVAINSILNRIDQQGLYH